MLALVPPARGSNTAGTQSLVPSAVAERLAGDPRSDRPDVKQKLETKTTSSSLAGLRRGGWILIEIQSFRRRQCRFHHRSAGPPQTEPTHRGIGQSTNTPAPVVRRTFHQIDFNFLRSPSGRSVCSHENQAKTTDRVILTTLVRGRG